jgi:hypothetical protein
MKNKMKHVNAKDSAADKKKNLRHMILSHHPASCRAVATRRECNPQNPLAA